MSEQPGDVTAPVDPTSPELRAWFEAETARLEAERAGLNLPVPPADDAPQDPGQRLPVAGSPDGPLATIAPANPADFPDDTGGGTAGAGAGGGL